MLNHRGPDFSKIIERESIIFHSSILWQQGKEMSCQPLESDGNVLLFNGDLYMDEISITESDTDFLFKLINDAGNEVEFLDIFKTIRGPFSIICLFQSNLYIARDYLGRNSLIAGKWKDQASFFTSVLSPGNEIKAMELPPLGIYKFNLNSKTIELFPYQTISSSHDHIQQQFKSIQEILGEIKINETLHLPKMPEYSFNYSFDEFSDDSFDNLLSHNEVNRACEQFIKLLSKSTIDRVQRTQQFCKMCTTNDCNHSHLGVLFSGGVDCSILTILADKFLDKKFSIDLMNVAFEAKNAKEINWNVPDRVTGLETLKELRLLCPDRKFNFIEINVDRKELSDNAELLTSLIYPLENVLDESIGAALYFASRGNGFVDGEKYKSQCRVLLMGSGADELFGGYTRHKNSFKRGGSKMLQEELEYDWIRLPSRNLSRDDRVIMDNGITVRCPYVEENFANFAKSLKPLQRCYPEFREGVGDKLLLRLCAYKLGLKNCSTFRKKALQFGSRIADSKQSAKDKSNFLKINLINH